MREIKQIFWLKWWLPIVLIQDYWFVFTENFNFIKSRRYKKRILAKFENKEYEIASIVTELVLFNNPLHIGVISRELRLYRLFYDMGFHYSSRYKISYKDFFFELARPSFGYFDKLDGYSNSYYERKISDDQLLRWNKRLL